MRTGTPPSLFNDPPRTGCWSTAILRVVLLKDFLAISEARRAQTIPLITPRLVQLKSEAIGIYLPLSSAGMIVLYVAALARGLWPKAQDGHVGIV